MITRNSGQAMVAIFLRLITAIGGSLSKSKVINIKLMLSFISKIAQSQGLPGLVKYLKTCAVLLQQYCGGYYISDVGTIGPRVSRTKSGLPRILPRTVRRLIRLGSFFWVRCSLTVLSLFRALKYPGKLKVSSITKPFTGRMDVVHQIIDFIPYFCKVFIKRPGRHLLGPMKIVPISKSSPNTKYDIDRDPSLSQPMAMSTSPLAALLSLRSLSKEFLDAIMTLTYLDDSAGARLRALITSTGPSSSINQGEVFLGGRWKRLSKFPNRIGKLGLKQEAAGKIRVFAMVDPFTQFVMSPLHHGIFKILKRYSHIDGTFNQLAPLKRAWGYKSLFSMDLSSATDRLPIMIQSPLIQQVFDLTDQERSSWEFLLIGREYWLKADQNSPAVPLKYAVGQPMGALSSWAMLALVHHLIVQYCAVKCGAVRKGKVFIGYAVLGDDVVIYHPKVAKTYHRVLTGLGVECNLAKSIMSPKGTGLEFAKKTFWRSVDVSPIPLTELHAALMSPTTLAQFGKVHNLKFPQLVKVAGFGYRVLGGLNKSLFRQNFKVRYLLMCSWIYNPEYLLLSFKQLVPWMSAYDMHSYFYQFYFSYLSRFLSRVKEIRVLLKQSHVWGVSTPLGRGAPWYAGPGMDGVVLRPESLNTRLYFLYESIYRSFRQKFQKLADITRFKILELRKYTHDNGAIPISPVNSGEVLLAWMKIGIATARLEQRFNSMSLKSLTLSDPDPVRGDGPKIHQLHTAFLSQLSEMSRHSEGLCSKPKMLESGFNPIRLLSIPGVRKLLRPMIIKQVLIRTLKRRFIWLLSWTTALSIFSYIAGVAETITCVIGIWTLLSSLIGGTMSTGSWFDMVWFYGCNIILHSIELLLAALIISNITKWTVTRDVIDILYQNYDSRFTSFWDCCRIFCNYQRGLLYDVAYGKVVDAATYVTSSIPDWSLSTNMIIGALGTWIFTFFVRWFFGI